VDADGRDRARTRREDVFASDGSEPGAGGRGGMRSPRQPGNWQPS